MKAPLMMPLGGLGTVVTSSPYTLISHCIPQFFHLVLRNQLHYFDSMDNLSSVCCNIPIYAATHGLLGNHKWAGGLGVRFLVHSCNP